MTKGELKNISKERKYISKTLDILDPNNSIENQGRESLLQRLGFLKNKVHSASISTRKNKLKLIDR